MTSYKDEKTGKWYCTFRYTDIRGKRVQKMKRGFALKRDAEKWERDFLSAEQNEDIAVGVLIKEYEDSLDYRVQTGDLKRSSRSLNQSTVNLYIKEHWKDVIVNKIKQKHITDWLKKIAEERNLSSSTLNRAKNTLHAILEFGIVNHGFKENPVDRVKSIKYNSPDLRAKLWTMEQYQAFRKTLKRKDMMVVFDVLFYAGLRLGEALAITPKDIIPYRIIVDKAMVHTMEHDEFIDTPKPGRSRVVEIPQFLYDELQAFIKENYQIKDTDVLFPINRETIRTHLNSHSKKCGNPIISPHILRHSYASYLLSITNIATVSKQLGHADPSITLKTYSHMLPGEDRNAVEALEKIAQNKK